MWKVTEKTEWKLGIAGLLGFVVSQAVRDVHLGHLFGNLGLYEVAFLAFGTAALVFGPALLLFKRHQIRLLISNWPTMLALNITTAISWLSYFQSLRLVEPAAANLAFCGVTPAAVALYAAVGLTSAGERKPRPLEKLMYWCLFGTVVLVAVIVVTGQSGFAEVDPATGLAGVALAAFAGFSITAEMIYAKRMNLAGVSSTAIVGVRFLLVTTISGAMLRGVATPYVGMSPAALAGQAIIFLVILIGPIYLVQAGIALTTPLMSGVLCSLGPIATFALQWAAGSANFSAALLAVILLYSGLAIAGALISAGLARRVAFP